MAPLSQNSKQHRLSNLGEEFCTATAKFFHIGFLLNWSTRSVHSFRKLYYLSELSHQISLLLNVVHLYKAQGQNLKQGSQLVLQSTYLWVVSSEWWWSAAVEKCANKTRIRCSGKGLNGTITNMIMMDTLVIFTQMMTVMGCFILHKTWSIYTLFTLFVFWEEFFSTVVAEHCFLSYCQIQMVGYTIYSYYLLVNLLNKEF